MKHEKYSDYLLDEMFEVINQKLDAIIAQTTRTNGSVTDLRTWRSNATGFLAALSMFVVPVLMYLIYLHIGN